MEIIEEKEGVKRFEGDWLDLFEVLDLIKYRPGLFIGNKRISTLWDFLQGYQFSLSMNKLNEKSFPDFKWFSTWIKGRIDTEYDLSAGWKHHILTTYNYDEEIAFDKFFDHLEEFKNAKPQCEIQHISESQKVFHNHNHGRFWMDVYDKTKTILIFGLPPSECYWCVYLNDKGETLAEKFEDSKKEMISQIGYNFQLNMTWKAIDEKEGTEKLKKLIKEYNNG